MLYSDAERIEAGIGGADFERFLEVFVEGRESVQSGATELVVKGVLIAKIHDAILYAVLPDPFALPLVRRALEAVRDDLVRILRTKRPEHSTWFPLANTPSGSGGGSAHATVTVPSFAPDWRNRRS